MPRFNSPMRLLCIFLLRKRNQANATPWAQQDKVWWKTHRWNNLWFWSNAHFSQWKYSYFLAVALDGDFKESDKTVLGRRKLPPWHTRTFLLWPTTFSQVYNNICFNQENLGYYSKGTVQNLSYYMEKRISAMITKGSSSLPPFFHTCRFQGDETS